MQKKIEASLASFGTNLNHSSAFLLSGHPEFGLHQTERSLCKQPQEKIMFQQELFPLISISLT